MLTRNLHTKFRNHNFKVIDQDHWPSKNLTRLWYTCTCTWYCNCVSLFSTLSLPLPPFLPPSLPPSAPAIIDPGENTTTTVPEDGIDYFQTECSAFSSTVLVELTDINGTNFLYCSATETNPGPLTENTIRNETQGLSRRTCTVPLPSGSTVSDLSSLFKNYK